jgi:hypothetical protein
MYCTCVVFSNIYLLQIKWTFGVLHSTTLSYFNPKNQDFLFQSRGIQTTFTLTKKTWWLQRQIKIVWAHKKKLFNYFINCMCA